MRKTDKKLDKQITLVLNDICETKLKDYSGFKWVTHLANFSNFPNSLKIAIVFDTNQSLTLFRTTNNDSKIISLIQDKLSKNGIAIKDPIKKIIFDTEENCEQQHGGNWQLRLS
ncbi:Fis family transcriptional regulator [Psychrosphaera sp. B3R10]|uniref:Fis family transcriptional regulator n=1 Tax=unclassified Psychrosphaera TaxID=2641570 RepID=UPI001C096B51|nr:MULTISPECIES: Fis family transcriptional regulator [unclassified Psychrosphaera]MBU2883332.1 Fis family transcriptional regulator [Psychrosphaera sp. I2R16]MBU2990574.1 Fis family transcriptional regulator [Psychrosphaera sp. B3R10]